MHGGMGYGTMLSPDERAQTQFVLSGWGKGMREIRKTGRSPWDFYRGKRVLVTGHTGFKGSWLCQALLSFGAQVSGYGLEPPTSPSLFSLLGLEGKLDSRIGDIRNRERLRRTVHELKPQLIFHLAAQPLVQEGYYRPVETYETNILGTLYLLDSVRETESVESLVNVTTDKVYRGPAQERGYREEDPLDGADPYANSKSCSDLITQSYMRSFFSHTGQVVSTARAGNVIGGGDFSPHRIVPNCVRFSLQKRPILLRNPQSVRPYQHVLEALSAYLLIGKEQMGRGGLPGSWNVGPDPSGHITTGDLADLFCRCWGDGMRWEKTEKTPGDVAETEILTLNCDAIQDLLGWRSKWSVEQAMEQTVSWYQIWRDGGDVVQKTREQIDGYFYGEEK